MSKRIALAFVGLLLIIGILGGIKVLQIRRMIAQGKQFVPPPETVTTAVAKSESWESTLTAVGNCRAVRGVTVAAEVPGKVVRIAFEAGAAVKTGDVLVQLDTASEDAQIPGAEATLALARRDLGRADELKALGIITVADHDVAVAKVRQARAQVDDLLAARAKKTVRAPFPGRLGLRPVNVGQILNPGEPIVSLQALDPIFVDFPLPQQELSRVKVGAAVRLTSDALPGENLSGTITAINSEVDAATRTVRLEATAANHRERLRPGMFVNVALVLPARQPVVAVPATSVLYAPYGDSVFVVEGKSGAPGKGGQGTLVLRQQFVRLGEKRGDFVAVVAGLKVGAQIASTGVFKLRNGQAVVVDNTLAPEFRLSPKPENE